MRLTRKVFHDLAIWMIALGVLVGIGLPFFVVLLDVPEATALDLVRYPHAAGGLGNVATVLGELAEEMAPERMVAILEGAESAHVQRLGYLLELVGQELLAAPLAVWVAKHATKTYRLRPDLAAADGELSPRWRLVINEKVEVDL